jgi:hypothetical protein
VITWGNGTGCPTATYTALLDHWASHGFVVIATDSVMTGSGTEMLNGINVLSSGTFADKVDLSRIGASGHSQGGGGTLAASRDPRIKCSAPIQPWLMMSGSPQGQLSGPSFIISGSTDFIVPAAGVRGVFSQTNVPAVYGDLKGVDHMTWVGGAPVIRGYTTAWFRWHLMDDTVAAGQFTGACAICSDSRWSVEKKNIN